MSNRTPSETVSAYIAAYNAHDDEALLSVCDENILVMHHNRALLAIGKSKFREMLKKYRGLMPNKRFANRRGFHVDGNVVVVEHTWYGTSLDDAPGFAEKGEDVVVDICTCFTVQDGLVVAYHDYG